MKHALAVLCVLGVSVVAGCTSGVSESVLVTGKIPHASAPSVDRDADVARVSHESPAEPGSVAEPPSTPEEAQTPETADPVSEETREDAPVVTPVPAHLPDTGEASIEASLPSYPVYERSWVPEVVLRAAARACSEDSECVGEEVCGWVSGVRQCTVPATAYRELATLAPAPAERATAYRPPVELVQVGCFNDADCSDGEVCGLFDGRQTCGPSITAAPHTVSFIQ